MVPNAYGDKHKHIDNVCLSCYTVHIPETDTACPSQVRDLSGLTEFDFASVNSEAKSLLWHVHAKHGVRNTLPAPVDGLAK
jgi:hypothetical protein